ncbi:hypothetical protein COPG_00091 [Colwellia phage 9A]|uniref:Uncharacterized protein n=1 Tax=Colwellia phage 9A TaxID=765765 RepID=I3UMH2_9CAUD|nr:hypothetical protein COPG_00091 [Colwellia phage 9A]AFK66687.1 hypothetical protein COPG_00091 [Colwellia phage 9A]
MQDVKWEETEKFEITEEKVAKPAMAVSVRNQQKASLYGIASVLVGLDGIPHRKAIKKVVKTLRKSLTRDMGTSNARELMQQNKGAVEMVFVGIRKFPNHTPLMIEQMIHDIVYNTEHGFLRSYLIGVDALGYGKS